MKKLVLLLVMILLPMVASAYDFALENSDGVTIYYNYILNGKETELEVTSFNPYYHNSYNKNVVIPEEVTYMNRTLKVTHIGSYAFYKCTGLTSVIIPNSVTSIGYNAFDGINLTFVISQIENPFNITGKSSSHPTFSLNTYNNATLYVPKGTSDKYKAAKGWKDFLYIEEGITNIISNVLANAVLMRSQNGTITIQGVDEGEQVSVFGINGTQAGTSISQNGAAIVNTSLQPGSIAIVKIGQKSVKVVIK